MKLKAKVTTTQGWTATVATEYKASPTCRNSIYATGNTQNYDDRSKPGVAAFQDAVNKSYPSHAGQDVGVGARGLGLGAMAHRRDALVRRAADPRVRRELPAGAARPTPATGC